MIKLMVKMTLKNDKDVHKEQLSKKDIKGGSKSNSGTNEEQGVSENIKHHLRSNKNLIEDEKGKVFNENFQRNPRNF